MTRVSAYHIPKVEDTYRLMASEARYRPAAPSDGLGNITVPIDQLDLDEEARRYALRHLTEESGQNYWIGLTGGSDVGTQPLIIEAARSLCAGEYELARKLLELALERIPAKTPPRPWD